MERNLKIYYIAGFEAQKEALSQRMKAVHRSWKTNRFSAPTLAPEPSEGTRPVDTLTLIQRD